MEGYPLVLIDEKVDLFYRLLEEGVAFGRRVVGKKFSDETESVHRREFAKFEVIGRLREGDQLIS